MTTQLNNKDIGNEFDRQVAALLQKKYPEAAGITTNDFVDLTRQLKKKLVSRNVPVIDIEHGTLPFVIVVTNDLVATEKKAQLITFHGKSAAIKLYPHSAADFTPIDTLKLSTQSIYAIVAIDRGKDTINLSPNSALSIIKKKHRTPLTIDEGIAIITHFPEFLIKNNCFSLLGSRFKGDKRVPAIWINSDNEPNLGWCWAGNPHTWLGSASCRERI